jgi:hypothetical protein
VDNGQIKYITSDKLKDNSNILFPDAWINIWLRMNNKNNNYPVLTPFIKAIETKTLEYEVYDCDNNNDNYEMVNHPSHYNNYDIEAIDMMARIWGPEATAQFCIMTAFKYRMRMGTKPNNSIEQDIKKEQWYLKKAKEFKPNL